jgi:hypothetical protein
MIITMKRIVLISMILLSVLSCEKDKKSDTSKKITGKVKLKGVFGEDINDLNNVSVSLNDSIWVSTNSSGEFEFENIPKGIYNMKIEKNAFEPFNCMEINYSGNDTILPFDRDVFTLSKYPQVELTTFEIGSGGITVVAGNCLDDISNVVDPKLDIVLLGNTTNTIDKENYGYISPGYNLIDLNPDGSFRFEFSVNGVYGQSLSHVYYKVYITSKGSVGNSLGTACNFYFCANSGSSIVEYILK